MRLVLDTNVVISGLIWGGLPRKILDLAREEKVSLYTTPALLVELADVLSREKFAKILSSCNLSPDKIIYGYSVLANTISNAIVERVVPRDADDDFVIVCAVAASADIIVTGDSDLLVLNPFQNIDILKPSQALHKIENITL